MVLSDRVTEGKIIRSSMRLLKTIWDVPIV